MTAEPETPSVSRPRLRWRRWLPRAALEGVLIVFSVILALAVTNWAEDRRDARRVAEMRQFLISEIRANRNELGSRYYVPHHEELKLAFARAGGAPDAVVTRASATPAIEKLFSEGGLHLAAPNDAVWTSVSASGLFEHMEPEEVFLLAQVYRAQESLESLNRAGYDNAIGLLNILSDEGGAHREMMRMTLYFEDLLQQERNLLRLYDQALTKMDPDGASATATQDDAAPSKR